MKLIVTIISTILVCTLTYAQKPKNTMYVKYDVVVSFGSICCGPASDDFLKNFINTFNKKNKWSINGYRLGGCGREGEFKILFSMPALKGLKKRKFLKALNNLVSNQNDINKAAKRSVGNIELAYNLPGEEISNCRGELVKWQ